MNGWIVLDHNIFFKKYLAKPELTKLVGTNESGRETKE